MKKILISLNLLLTILLLWSVAGNLKLRKSRAPRSSAAAVKTVKKAAPTAGKTVSVPLPELDTATEKVIALDVFNNVRSPLANVRNGRTELTLLGTFKAGKVEGAIIRQKTSARQFNPFLMQAMMAAGPPPGGPGGPGGPPNMGGGPGNMGGGPGNMGGGPGNMGGRSGRRGGFNQWSRLGGNGNGNSNSAYVKQYVRIGETLSNGYTLVEVTRTGATLVRGNDKMELELQAPSKNRVSSSNNNSRPRLNSTQQFQQAQMFMQGQMMRTMQQMQHNMMQGGGNQGGGAPRGARR